MRSRIARPAKTYTQRVRPLLVKFNLYATKENARALSNDAWHASAYWELAKCPWRSEILRRIAQCADKVAYPKQT